MAKVMITEQYLSDTADGIRAKLGVQTEYKPSEFKAAILSIPGASTLGTKTVTEPGTYNASSDSLDGYSSFTVDISSYDSEEF